MKDIILQEEILGQRECIDSSNITFYGNSYGKLHQNGQKTSSLSAKKGESSEFDPKNNPSSYAIQCFEKSLQKFIVESPTQKDKDHDHEFQVEEDNLFESKRHIDIGDSCFEGPRGVFSVNLARSNLAMLFNIWFKVKQNIKKMAQKTRSH